jgi:hypothetical protein
VSKAHFAELVEATRWEELGHNLREETPVELWKAAGQIGRAELLEKAHQYMRPAFELEEQTRLVFLKEVEIGDADLEGMGFDDVRGEYVLVAFSELEREDPGPVLAGLAHELRHAFQLQSIGQTSPDPRVGEWAACHRGAEPRAESGALERDARRAQAIVAEAFEAAG